MRGNWIPSFFHKKAAVMVIEAINSVSIRNGSGLATRIGKDWQASSKQFQLSTLKVVFPDARKQTASCGLT